MIFVQSLSLSPSVQFSFVSVHIWILFESGSCEHNNNVHHRQNAITIFTQPRKIIAWDWAGKIFFRFYPDIEANTRENMRCMHVPQPIGCTVQCLSILLYATLKRVRVCVCVVVYIFIKIQRIALSYVVIIPTDEDIKQTFPNYLNTTQLIFNAVYVYTPFFDYTKRFNVLHWVSFRWCCCWCVWVSICCVCVCVMSLFHIPLALWYECVCAFVQ